MNFKKTGLYVILLVLLAGCSKEDRGDPINYEVIFEGHLSYGEEEIIPEKYLVFNTETDWNNFISEIERVNPSQANNFKDIEFDFDDNNLILIIGKYYTYCCSKIDIEGVYKEEGGKVVVKYKESGPGGFTAISQAYMLLKISKEEAD